MESFESATTVERMLIEQAKAARVPINGSIELLPLCNMNCDMCYVRLSREEMENLGCLRTVEEWLSLAEQMKHAGTLFLLLTGGEPLLYPGFKELYVKLLEMGMILTINTNGTLITEEWALFFSKYKPRRINITLYGADENAYTSLCHYPGGFHKVMEAIHLLKKHNIDVKLSSSLTPHNKNDMDKLIELGNELDIPVRVDTYMMPAERERNKPFNMQSRLSPTEAAYYRIATLKKEMPPTLFQKYKEQVIYEIEHGSDQTYTDCVSCMAGNCSFTINWQGEMRPCVVMSEPAVPVFETGFENAWNHLVQQTKQIRLNSKCKNCTLRPLCRTCAACALLECGSYEGIPDYMCAYAKESYQKLLQLN